MMHRRVLCVLPLLLPCLGTCAQTAHDVSSQIRGGCGPTSPVEGGDEGLLSDRPGGFTPPAFYRALSRRSVGRYVLATSSLVGECARVYTPAPFGVLASSLWSRFAIGLGSRGRDYRGSSGQKKSSPFSYDRFMSPDIGKDDEEEDLGVDPANSPVPPDKYGRVSSAFLLRHAIGGLANTNGGLRKVDGREDIDTAGGAVSADASPLEGKNEVTTVNLQSIPTAAAGSVLKSLGSLGSGRKKQAVDDMDLLSESEDDDWDEFEGEGGRSRTSGVQGPGVVPASVPKASTSRRRNLVDADDSASTLVEKMRLAKKPKGDGRVRGRRTNHGRSRHVK